MRLNSFHVCFYSGVDLGVGYSTKNRINQWRSGYLRFCIGFEPTRDHEIMSCQHLPWRKSGWGEKHAEKTSEPTDGCFTPEAKITSGEHKARMGQIVSSFPCSKSHKMVRPPVWFSVVPWRTSILCIPDRSWTLHLKVQAAVQVNPCAYPSLPAKGVLDIRHLIAQNFISLFYINLMKNQRILLWCWPSACDHDVVHNMSGKLAQDFETKL